MIYNERNLDTMFIRLRMIFLFCIVAFLAGTASAAITVTDRDSNDVSDEMLIDSDMIHIQTESVGNVAKYNYKYVVQSKAPTSEEWTAIEIAPFYRDMYFYREPGNQWVWVEVVCKDGKKIAHICGLKGGVLTAPPDAPISAWDYQDRMGLGFDTSWPLRADNYNYSTDVEVEYKRAGFKHFRQRINAFTPREPDKTELIWDMDLIQRIIKKSMRHGMLATVSISASVGFHTPADESDLKKFLICWKILSETFANYSHRVALEIFVETGKRFKSDEHIREWEEAIVPIIRENNPTRIVIHSSASHVPRGIAEGYKLKEEWRDYAILQAHRFAGGFRRTSDGMSRWTAGTQAERDYIEEEVTILARWRDKNKIPVYWGAFMPMSLNHCDNHTISEGSKIAEFFVSLCKKYKIPAAFNSADVFYKRETSEFREEFLPLFEALNGDAVYRTEDRDGDGLTNDREKELGTDPDNFDTDNDGMTDGEEIKWKFNPLDPKDGADGLDEFGFPRGAAADADKDGIPNRLEIYYGSVSLKAKQEWPFDPRNSADGALDYDGDGMSNAQEVSLILHSPINSKKIEDLKKPNSLDKDGLPAIEEINKYKTDPLKFDTDGDGIGDGEEVSKGSEPLKPN